MPLAISSYFWPSWVWAWLAWVAALPWLLLAVAAWVWLLLPGLGCVWLPLAAFLLFLVTAMPLSSLKMSLTL